MATHPFDYDGIRVWAVRNGTPPADWRELQKRAARESAPLDALYLDAQGTWVTARDLAPDHEFHGALALDRERRRRGFSPLPRSINRRLGMAPKRKPRHDQP